MAVIVGEVEEERGLDDVGVGTDEYLGRWWVPNRGLCSRGEMVRASNGTLSLSVNGKVR